MTKEGPEAEKGWGEFEGAGAFQISTSGAVYRDFYKQASTGNIKKARDANILSILKTILKFARQIGWKDFRLDQTSNPRLTLWMETKELIKQGSNSTTSKKKWLSPKTKYSGEEIKKSKSKNFFSNMR